MSTFTDELGWEDDTVLPPLRATCAYRGARRVIVSQLPPPSTITVYTLEPTTTHEGDTTMHEDRFTAENADENVGVIERWLTGQAPLSTSVSITAVARAKARAKYGPERGRSEQNVANAMRAFRKVIVERCAKDDMTKMPEMTVVLNTTEWVPASVAWLNCDLQVRFFGLTDLDTTIPMLAGHPVEVVAVLFTPNKLRDFQDRDGYWRKIPSDFDPGSYTEILGVWEHMDDASEARDQLADAVLAQIRASRTADEPELSDLEYDDDDELIVYRTPVDEFSHG